MEEIERIYFKSDFETMKLTFHFLRMNLMCNAFIIYNPECDHIFPYRGNVGLLSGYLHTSKDILKEIKDINSDTKKSTGTKKETAAYIKSLNKKLDRICKGKENFENIDIRNEESYKKLYDYFYIMELMYDKAMEATNRQNFTVKDFPEDILSLDVTQKYFEFIGYWTARMEEKGKKRNSGKGQKDAKERRVKQVSEAIVKEFIDDFEKDVLFIDKGFFYKALCKTFCGSEDYPRHPQTIKAYRESVEQKLGKKIKIVKKVP